MVQGSETGGRGQGLSVLRAVLIAGCVVLGLALAVVVLLAVVYREPTAEEVIQALRDEGLEVGETRQVDREGDRSFVPKTYKEQVSFTVPSQGERVGGRVFTFESPEDLEQVREHYEGFGELFSSYVYVKNKVLVQISGSMPEEQAERYGEVLWEL
jgi:hypothetical protein